MKRASWGWVPKHCRICGQVGPRTHSKRSGLVHKRCLPDDERKEYDREMRKGKMD